MNVYILTHEYAPWGDIESPTYLAVSENVKNLNEIVAEKYGFDPDFEPLDSEQVRVVPGRDSEFVSVNCVPWVENKEVAK